MYFAYKLMSYGQLDALELFDTYFFSSNLSLAINRARMANLREENRCNHL